MREAKLIDHEDISLTDAKQEEAIEGTERINSWASLLPPPKCPLLLFGLDRNQEMKLEGCQPNYSKLVTNLQEMLSIWKEPRFSLGTFLNPFEWAQLAFQSAAMYCRGPTVWPL